MSETNENKSQTPVVSAEDRIKALKGGRQAVQEIQKLLRSGHFAGARAAKLVACLGYLQSLEQQYEAQIEAEKK